MRHQKLETVQWEHAQARHNPRLGTNPSLKSEDHARRACRNSLARPIRALVLGNACVATRIADGLIAEGLEPELEGAFAARSGVELPLSTDLDAYENLRRFLGEYQKQTMGNGLVHPGVSAWADRSELSGVCQELGLELVSPAARIVSLFGNKLNLLLEAEKAKIPHLV